MNVSQLGINSITTRHADLPEAIAAYATAGFRNVEVHLPLVHSWLAEGHTVADVRQLLADHEMRCIGGFQTSVECFTSPEKQRANHAIHLENAQLLHDLGGGVLVVGTDGPESTSLAALDVVAETLSGLAQQLEGLDVTLALEFNWSPLVKSLASAARVREMVNHPQVGILFDPAHYYTTVTKFEDIRADTVRWISHVHVDDMADKPGELSDCNADRRLPGQGVLDLAAIFNALETHGYDGFFSIEMFSDDLWSLPATEAARQCYESLLPYCT
jgi:4-hydroxyphenylpyruvate dioxygenase